LDGRGFHHHAAFAGVIFNEIESRLGTSLAQHQRCLDGKGPVHRWALVCVLVLSIIRPSAASPATHSTRPAPRPIPQQIEVLFLSSLDPDLPDVAAMIEQTEAQILVGSDKPVRFSSEYLDFATALEDRTRGKATASYLLDKYRGQTFQLIVAIGEETVMFAQPMQSKLFPDGTLLFFVVDPQSADLWMHQTPATTGVIRETNYLPTLQLALRQNPGTSRVIVVAGSSAGEQIDLRIARNQFRGYESNLKFEYVTDLDLSELGPRLASAQPGSVILFLDFASDPSGQKLIPARILPAISNTATRPIYGTFSSVVGNGAVGGSVADLGEVGRTLGHDGARILKGEKAEDILVSTGNFQHYVIDWHQLHRWGIPEDQLPADSVLLNWEYSPWELYRWRILGLLAVLLLETVLIGLLLLNVVRRKRAQRALAQKERELEEAQRLARIGSWTLDVDKGEINCSDELYRIYGLQPRRVSVRGEEFKRLFTPENRERLTAAMKQALKAGSIQEVEVEAVLLDGSRRWSRIRGEAVRDASGGVIYLHGTAQDITERKLSQTKLQESEDRLTAIVASAMDAIIAVDDQQHVLVFNASAERMFGCGASEAIGGTMDRFIPQRFRKEHVAHLRRFGETRETSRTMGTLGALWALRSNGEEFPIEASISHVEDAGKKLFTVIIRDITERLRAEQAAAESEKRFRLIANTAPVLIWMSDPNKLCSYFNQSWLEFTGRSMDQELGMGWLECVHAQDMQGCISTYTQFFDRHERFSMEYRLRRHDGKYRWVLDIGVPRFNDDGSFAGYVGCCMDISDLKQARATVIEFSGRLLRAGEEERARIARELHDDINQRLALLANGLQEAEQAAAADKDPSRRQELRVLWQMTNEIATDIQHMSHQLHPSKLHYLGLTSTVRQLCNEFAQQHKIEMECIVKSLPDDLDENVSLNLFRTVQESLRNAVKHSKAHHVKVELTCQSNLVHLLVSDDGVGFDPEERRADHGLGLVSMRERLRSIGGEFSIWSKPFHGTVVEAKVPVATKRAPSELTVAGPTDAA
jgi:PAS domain S-box-containing protein